MTRDPEIVANLMAGALMILSVWGLVCYLRQI